MNDNRSTTLENPTLNPLLNLEEASTYLNTPVNTLHRLRARGDFDIGRKVGKRWQFRLSELDTWYDNLS